MRDIDRFRGCLIGGAAGDALGYAVEFLREADIFRRYGRDGITGYDLAKGIAEISDDTQMTLFTAAGLLTGDARRMRGVAEPYESAIAAGYSDWLKTQQKRYPVPDEDRSSWLMDVPELFSRRAPGITCLNALSAGIPGTAENPINNSKGCGGVMRVAPIGLFFNDRKTGIREIDRIGAEAAAVTHGHELGYIPAAALVHIVHRLSQDDSGVEEAVQDAVSAMKDMWPKTDSLDRFVFLMDKALLLAHGSLRDVEAIRQLGEGWVAEETLAIAAYCAVKYPEDFDRAMIASVNHNGDSDSTGAVTGNILGAKLGLSGIPQKYTGNLELRDTILEMADDLWRGSPNPGTDPVWEMKYIPGGKP